MNLDKYYGQRKLVADTMTRLYKTRLTTTSGGNVSCRIDNELFCISPSSLDKSKLSPELIAIVSMEGENLTPHLPLSIESEMHRLILAENPEINAVVHAHPVFSTLYACAGEHMDTSLTTESWFLLGRPVMSGYHKMGTYELARDVADCAKRGRIVLLKNHGVLATGKDMLSAFDAIEVLENAAKITAFSTLLRNAGVKTDALSEEAMKEMRPDLFE